MTILFYPEIPKPKSRVYRICKEYNIRFHNNPCAKHDIHFFWSYTQNSIIPDNITLHGPDVINRGCWDVSKQKINDIFNDIKIDPFTYVGTAVAKYKGQGQHSKHKLVQCPCLPEQNYIYQRYIENKEGDLYVKYRLLYANGITCITKQKRKDCFGKFPNRVLSFPMWRFEYVGGVEIMLTHDIFTEEQEADFMTKCDQFGFDFGEVDFLLDADKTPIIIDINNVVYDIWWGNPYLKKIQESQFLNFINSKII